MCSCYVTNHNVFSACPSEYPSGYTPVISANKAYRMLDTKMNFEKAKQACQNEGSVLAMPRTVEDINAMKGLFDRK